MKAKYPRSRYCMKPLRMIVDVVKADLLQVLRDIQSTLTNDNDFLFGGQVLWMSRST